MPQYVEVQGNVVEFPDGMAAADIEAAIKANAMSIKPAAALSAGKELNSIPRQLGLTARYGLEGLANTAQLLTEPIRNAVAGLARSTQSDSPLAMKKEAPQFMPLGQATTNLLDAAGLPSPQGANERVIADATRLVAGAGGLGAAAGAPVKIGQAVLTSGAERLPGMAGEAARLLSSNMKQQLASAAGAGLAGGASREAGGGPLMEAGASLLGGVAAGAGVNAIDSLSRTGRALLNRATMGPQQMDAQISAVLNRAGVDYSQLPAGVRNSLRTEMASALRANQELDPQAVARLADFMRVGATPTRGAVTQNPVQITREMNLAKMGANSSDQGLQGLAMVQNQNNASLIRNLNDQGAARGNLQAAGETVNNTVLGRQASLRGQETAAWNAARQSPGYTQPIEPFVISNINRALGDEGMMPFLNPTISRYMEAFQTGQAPFTPQAYRNLQSMLANEMSKGGNEAAAAGIARRALEATELRPVTNPVNPGNLPITGGMADRLRALDAAPGDAIEAVNRARAATRAAYAYEDSNPLVRSILSDGAAGDPLRIARRYIVGGTPNEAAMLAQEVGDAGRGPIRDAIVAHLKDKALNGASDEVGKFSQSAYNKALREIGERKLSLFFSPEEVAQLQAVGRVASYTQVQPVGSAVNNSNSSAMTLGRAYDALMGLARRVPLGQSLIADPLQNIEISIRNNQAQNVLPGLLAPAPAVPMTNRLLLPAAATGGLLAAPSN